jgi:ADP-ribose pyrophosphatase
MSCSGSAWSRPREDRGVEANGAFGRDMAALYAGAGRPSMAGAQARVAGRAAGPRGGVRRGGAGAIRDNGGREMTSENRKAAAAHPDAEIVEHRIAFKGAHLGIDQVRFRHRLHSGGWSALREYEVLRRGQAVGIVLYDPERDAVVLIEQFRLPALIAGASPWQVEIPAGLIDADGETPQDVAIRETREETGLELIGAPIAIQRYLPSAGGTDECVFLFCGRVDSRQARGVHGLPEEHEDIRVLVKSAAEIERLLDAGGIESGHSLLALYWLLRRRERLRLLWAGT